MPYKNRKTGDIISDSQFRQLPSDEKILYIYQDEGLEDDGYNSGLEEDFEEEDFLDDNEDLDDDYEQD